MARILVGMCPCGSRLAYDACCGPLHSGEATAATAEALMRSRYSAFAIGEVPYLLASWHPSTRPATLQLDPDREWQRLQIRAAGKDWVHFIAHFWDGAGREYGRQEERSRFRREDGRWYYLDAEG